MSAPKSDLFPASVAPLDAVPLAMIIWQFLPLAASAQHPAAYFKEAATLLFLPRKGSWLSLQKSVRFLPLMVVNPFRRHPTIVARMKEQNICQPDPSTIDSITLRLASFSQLYAGF